MGQVVHDTQELELAAAQSMGADFVTPVHEVTFFDMGSIHIQWTGADATTGVFLPQASVNGTCWCNLLAEAVAKRADGPSGCQLYIFPSYEFKYVRLKYKASTNTAGTVNVISFAKRRRTVP